MTNVFRLTKREQILYVSFFKKNFYVQKH